MFPCSRRSDPHSTDGKRRRGGLMPNVRKLAARRALRVAGGLRLLGAFPFYWMVIATFKTDHDLFSPLNNPSSSTSPHAAISRSALRNPLPHVPDNSLWVVSPFVSHHPRGRRPRGGTRWPAGAGLGRDARNRSSSPISFHQRSCSSPFPGFTPPLGLQESSGP